MDILLHLKKKKRLKGASVVAQLAKHCCFRTSSQLAYLERQWIMVQILVPLPFTWEVQMELQAPIFSLTQHWLLWPFEE